MKLEVENRPTHFLKETVYNNKSISKLVGSIFRKYFYKSQKGRRMVNEEDSKNNLMLVVGVKEGVDYVC